MPIFVFSYLQNSIGMERTLIEKLILVIAWTGLIGGVFLSVGGWAVLLEIIALSDRIRKLEQRP